MSLTIERFVTTGFGWTKPAPNSQKSYRNHISQFEAFLKDRNKTASDGTVNDQDIADYIECLKAKYHQNTVSAKVAAIKSYFKWLNKEEALTFRPQIHSQKPIKTIHRELSSLDLDAITKTITGTLNNLYNQRDLAIFSLIVYCGFKTSEVVVINTEDVNFEAGVITVQNEKRSFRAAFTEMMGYKTKKLQDDCVSKRQSSGSNGKEPFFLNKHSDRLGARSLRRRLLEKPNSKSPVTMRDLRYTYLKNLNRITSINPDLVEA